MKKIALWKVIVLSIVTLGIYSIIWLARRRNELVDNYQQKVPSWLWLVIPGAISIALIVPAVIFTFLLISNDQLIQALLLIGIVSLLLLASAIICLWWVWRFSSAMSRVIEGRVPTIWAFLIYLFLGVALIYVHQFYINRYATDKISTKNVGPSTKFIVLTVVAIVASVILSGASSASMPDDSFQKLQENSAVGEKANRLIVDYTTCTDTLQKDYPEVTVENEAAYNKAYDVCNKIRIEQNAAANRYNKYYLPN